MTPKEITEGNKLIAEFMGAKSESRYGKYPDGAVRFPITISQVPDEASGHEVPYIHLKDLKYHSSWLWLMPVVKKAYDIYLNERGSKYIAEFILTSKYECFWEIKIVSLIEYVWASVVEFIKWHNQQK